VMHMLHPANVQAVPIDACSLRPLVSRIREHRGVDLAPTVSWLGQFHSPKDLTEAVRVAWRATSLPLRTWAEQIVRTGVFCHAPHLLFGIYVELDSRPLTRVIQQAPQDRSTCNSVLEGLFGHAPGPLAELAAAAPGLMADDGAVIALWDFISYPMETAAGPNHTVQDKLYMDLGVWTRDACACELIWRTSRTDRHWVILSYDTAPFLYIDDVTPALSELDLTVSEVILRYLDDPDGIFDVLRLHIRKGGRRIDYVVAGDEARRRFERLDVHDQVAVALRAASRAACGRDTSPVWNDVDSVLRACGLAIAGGAPIESTTTELAVDLGVRWQACDNANVVPVTLLSYLQDVVAACGGKLTKLRYPRFLLKLGASCLPVYEGVMQDMRLLSEYRSQAPPDDGCSARRRLLECPP
jgi:hypothetical protein